MSDNEKTYLLKGNILNDDHILNYIPFLKNDSSMDKQLMLITSDNDKIQPILTKIDDTPRNTILEDLGSPNNSIISGYNTQSRTTFRYSESNNSSDDTNRGLPNKRKRLNKKKDNHRSAMSQDERNIALHSDDSPSDRLYNYYSDSRKINPNKNRETKQIGKKKEEKIKKIFDDCEKYRTRLEGTVRNYNIKKKILDICNIIIHPTICFLIFMYKHDSNIIPIESIALLIMINAIMSGFYSYLTSDKSYIIRRRMLDSKFSNIQNLIRRYLLLDDNAKENVNDFIHYILKEYNTLCDEYIMEKMN